MRGGKNAATNTNTVFNALSGPRNAYTPPVPPTPLPPGSNNGLISNIISSTRPRSVFLPHSSSTITCYVTGSRNVGRVHVAHMFNPLK